MRGVARGLIYIHGQGMIHGDLKGVRFSTPGVTLILSTLLAKANILIDQSGCARLADFGLLTIISDPKYLLSSSSHTQGGTVRWMSPERIAPERFGFKNSRPTVASDCYALGMVVYETISGNLPFYKDTDLTVFMKVVVEGERPPRGAEFTRDLWEMLEWCWVPKPNDRPTIEDVLHCLEVAPNLPEPPPSVDEEIDEDGDGWDSVASSGGDSLELFATEDLAQSPSIPSPSTPAKMTREAFFGFENGPSEIYAAAGPRSVAATVGPFSPTHYVGLWIDDQARFMQPSTTPEWLK